MSGYALTPLAKADIFDIWSYIAEDNKPLVADTVRDEAFFHARALANPVDDSLCHVVGPFDGHRIVDLRRVLTRRDDMKSVVVRETSATTL
jgi:plasmid stabilization system protein ParE